MRSKIITALVAGGLLVGAGFATSVISAPGTASAQEESTDTDQERKGPFHRGFELLSGVLEDLVGENTISQDDADAVLNAVEEKTAELRAEHEATRELIKSFLEDDVITQEEASQLPDDHPIFSERFDEAWEDGELTLEEVRRARHGHRGHRADAKTENSGAQTDNIDRKSVV